jgi:8-oxo-dGTP diphosphatase
MEFYTVLPFVVAWIKDKEGRVLVGRHPHQPGKPYPGLWDIPGGKMREGESPEGCLVREVAEETGFKVEKALLKDTFHNSGKDIVAPGATSLPSLALCYQVKVSGRFSPSEMEEMRWVFPAELKRLPLTPWCRYFSQSFL